MCSTSNGSLILDVLRDSCHISNGTLCPSSNRIHVPAVMGFTKKDPSFQKHFYPKLSKFEFCLSQELDIFPST